MQADVRLVTFVAGDLWTFDDDVAAHSIQTSNNVSTFIKLAHPFGDCRAVRVCTLVNTWQHWCTQVYSSQHMTLLMHSCTLVHYRKSELWHSLLHKLHSDRMREVIQQWWVCVDRRVQCIECRYSSSKSECLQRNVDVSRDELFVWTTAVTNSHRTNCWQSFYYNRSRLMRCLQIGIGQVSKFRWKERDKDCYDGYGRNGDEHWTV